MGRRIQVRAAIRSTLPASAQLIDPSDETGVDRRPSHVDHRDTETLAVFISKKERQMRLCMLGGLICHSQIGNEALPAKCTRAPLTLSLTDREALRTKWTPPSIANTDTRFPLHCRF